MSIECPRITAFVGPPSSSHLPFQAFYAIDCIVEAGVVHGLRKPRTAARARRNLPCSGTEWFAVCAIRGSSEDGRATQRYTAYLSNSQLRPTAIDRKLGAGREGRIEREEEDGLGDLLRRPPALHGNHAGHLLLNLGGRIAKRFLDDRRIGGTGRHRVDANLREEEAQRRAPERRIAEQPWRLRMWRCRPFP